MTGPPTGQGARGPENRREGKRPEGHKEPPDPCVIQTQRTQLISTHLILFSLTIPGPDTATLPGVCPQVW